MISANVTPIKANHKIVYSTRNNTFIRNKKLIEKEEYYEPDALQLSNHITEKIFLNNQAISSKLSQTKSQKQQRNISTWITDSPKADTHKNTPTDFRTSLNGSTSSRKFFNRTLSVPKITQSDTISTEHYSKLKRCMKNSHGSSIYDPSIEQSLPKLEESSSIDPIAIVKEAKAMKRFLDDRKKLRGLLKQKADISHLSDIKHETSSHRGSQILDIQIATQSQPTTVPILESELDSLRSQAEPRFKQLRSATLSPMEARDRPPVLNSLPSLAYVDLPKRQQLNRFPRESTSLSSIQFVPVESQKSNDTQTIHLNSAILSPLTSQTTFFSKAIFSDNKYHEGALLGLENVQASGYLDGFTETRLGGSLSLKTLNAIPKISEKAEQKPSELLKLKGDETIENQPLLQELRREIPSILSGQPPSRNDTVLLSRWIENKLKVIVESANLTEKQKCLNCDEVFNVGLNELVRQVRFECTERAELLLKIWMSYLRVFNQFKLSLMADQAKLHDDYEDTYNRVHKVYKDIIAKGDEQREKLQKQVEQLISEKETLQAQCDKLLQAEAGYLQKNRDLKSLLKKTAKQLQKLKEDNDSMNMRLMSRTVAQSVKLDSDSQKKTPGFSRAASTMSIEPDRRLSNTAAAFLFPASMLQKKPEIQEEDSASDASSENLVYEVDDDPGAEKEKQNIHKIEQLNSLALVHLTTDVIKHDREVQTDVELYERNHCVVECQTDLRLLNANYDELLSQQNNLDELVIDHKLKKEVDVIDSESFDFLNHSYRASINKQDSLRIPTTVSNLDSHNRTSRLNPPKVLIQTVNTSGLIRMKSENLAQTVSEFKYEEETTNNLGVPEIHADKMRVRSLILHDGKVTQEEAKEDHRDHHGGNPSLNSEQNLLIEEENKTPEKIASRENIAIKIIPITVVDEKEGETENEKFENRARGLKINENDTEDHSVKIPHVENPDLSHLLAVSAAKVNVSSLSRSHQLQEDDHTQINLDELDPSEIYSSGEEEQFEEESELLSQASFSIILEEDSEEIPRSLAALKSKPKKASSKKEDLLLDIDSRMSEQLSSIENESVHHQEGEVRLRSNSEQKHGMSTLSTPQKRASQQFSLNPRKSRVSIRFNAGANAKINKLHTLATIKNKIDQLMQAHQIGHRKTSEDELSEINPDSQGFVLDKTKYLQIVRLYKVESEKNKIIQQHLHEVKDTFERELKSNASLSEENQLLTKRLDELTNQINKIKAALENSVPKCKHGRCQFCREEEAAAKKEEEEEEEKAQNKKDEETEEVGDKVANQRRRRRRDNKRVPYTTSAQSLQLGRRNAIDRKENPAPAIIAKLRTKKMSQFKNFMPVKMILKQINSIYEERLRLSTENAVIKDEELCCFTYNMFLNTFGFKKIAEQKLIVLVLSVKKNLHILRINLFGRFLGLIEGPGNYTVDEFNKYIECLEFLNNCNLGTHVVTNEGDSKAYTPYVRFLEYLKHFAEGKLGMEEYIEFKKEFDSIKETDPKGVNRYGLIDVDLALMKVLAKNRIVNNRVKQFVIDAFHASDIEGEKTCNLRKFKLLFKHMEPEKYDEEEAEDMFEDYAEANEKGELVLSYDKFAALCVEVGIFSEYIQDKFLMITKKEQITEKFLELRKDSAELRDEMETNLRRINDIEPKEREIWAQSIDCVWQRVLNPSISDKEYKSLLITSIILREELRMLASTKGSDK